MHTFALGSKLRNVRNAYIAVSRGVHDAQIVTNNATLPGRGLDGVVSHALAIQQPKCHEPSSSSPLISPRSIKGFEWVLSPIAQTLIGAPFIEESGKATLNLAPPSELFSAQSRPPCASTIERDTAKPIPIPFAFVVTNASKILS